MPVRDAWPMAVKAPRLRCNGPDAHETELVSAASEPRVDEPARTRVA